MIVVNFFGESNTGKSTHALALCSELKKHGIRAEIVRESCKDYFFEGTQYKLENQFKITGDIVDQIRMYEHGGIDVVVTDSPVLLGALYTQVYNVDINLSNAIRTQFHKDDNMNILLECDVPFDEVGRGSSGINRDTIRTLLLREALKYELECKTTELTTYKVLVNKIRRRIDEGK